LEAAGVEVINGVLAEECEDLNLIFNFNMEHGSPLFAAKIATTIDGRIATREGDSKWVTGEIARRDVMRWRRYFPAIAVGAGTVMADDPWLTSRIDGEDEWCPIRFVFDRELHTAGVQRQLFLDHYKDRTIVVTVENADPQAVKYFRESGIQVWQLPASEGRVCLNSFREKCKEDGINGVLFEGGAGLLSSLLKERMLNYLFAYRAPKFFADESSIPSFKGVKTESMDDAFSLMKVRHSILGDDQLMRGFVLS
jgi:diaminohydroxyphosphoribosylaminopyrimidine deaminase / 5-amino-6-(5-phosphoribosylamino)uracil reductase